MQQQIAEITRIASQTSFNGLNVLDGSSGVTTYQVGANVGNTISINLSQGVRADQIGQVATSTGTAVTAVALNGSNLTVQVGNGVASAVGASVAGTGAGESASSAYAKVQAINSAGVAGLTASASTTATGAAAFSNITGGSVGTTYGLTINGVAIYAAGTAIASGQVLTGSNVATQINLYSSQTGVTAALSATGALQLTAADGRDIAQTETVVAGTGGTGTGAGIAAATTQGTITLSAASNIVIGGAGAADIGFTAGSISLGNATLANSNVLTVDGCQRHDRGDRLGAGDGQRLPEPVGRHPEPLHVDGQQPSGDQPEPDRVAQHHSGCGLRGRNGQFDQVSSVAAGGYLGVGPGQPRAAIDSQAFAVIADQ